MNKRKLIVQTLAGLAAIAATTNLSHATTYYLNTDIGAGDSWNNLNDWWTGTNGTGTHPGTLAGNTFDSNGYSTRTPTTTTATFGDAATQLVLEGGTVGVKVPANGIVNIATLITETPLTHVGGPEANGIGNSSSGTIAVNVTTFTNSATMTLNTFASNRTINFTAATVTGSGDLNLDSSSTSAVGTIGLNLGNATGFTGNITFSSVDRVALVFQDSFVSGGGLIVTSLDTVNLGGFGETFSSLSVAGTVYAPGTYSYTALNSANSSIFTTGQLTTGSITVTPEPTSLLLLLPAGLLLRTRRKRARLNDPNV